jgi:hypothetical protein
MAARYQIVADFPKRFFAARPRKADRLSATAKKILNLGKN